MQLVNAWKTVVLGNYATFSGRARRSECWWFALANLCAYLLLIVLGGIAGAISDTLGGLVSVLVGIYWLGIIVPSLAVLVRRLHDTGRSGWWYFISFIPLVGGIILIVFLASDSAKGSNKYGASAKYPG